MTWARFLYRDRNIKFAAALFDAHRNRQRKRRAF
jgi:hypothetical protein